MNGYETDDTQIEDSDCEEPHQSYRRDRDDDSV